MQYFMSISQMIQLQSNASKGIEQRIRVNTLACDGCGSCAELCPMGVFEIIRTSDVQLQKLSLLHRLKVFLGGNTKSCVAYPDACVACGLCEQMCHKRAIRLAKDKCA